MDTTGKVLQLKASFKLMHFRSSPSPHCDTSVARILRAPDGHWSTTRGLHGESSQYVCESEGASVGSIRRRRVEVTTVGRCGAAYIPR